MSRCAHAKTIYPLRKLPRCSKCKEEFVLVAAVYEDKDKRCKPVIEWECPKCGKVLPRNLLKEEGILEQDVVLHEWCLNEQRIREKRRSRKTN
jgi:hypothetical protein